MPGERGDINLRFEFHMSRSPLGILFFNYEHILTVPNNIINQILTQASRSVTEAIARDPDLERRPVQEMVMWTHPVEEIALYVEPEVPNMEYADLYTLFRFLRLWAQEYEAEQCSFQIWGFPGMAQQRKLGMGHFLMDPDPPLKSS